LSQNLATHSPFFQDICGVAAVSIEATSKRIEQAVENMLDVFKTSYEKVKEGSRPKLKPGETESVELVSNEAHRIKRLEWRLFFIVSFICISRSLKQPKT